MSTVPNPSMEQMRNFILLAETMLPGVDETPVVTEPVVETVSAPPAILSELRDITARLREFCETEAGDYALGVETGMQRAADMIENLIHRHTEGDNLG